MSLIGRVFRRFKKEKAVPKAPIPHITLDNNKWYARLELENYIYRGSGNTPRAAMISLIDGIMEVYGRDDETDEWIYNFFKKHGCMWGKDGV